MWWLKSKLKKDLSNSTHPLVNLIKIKEIFDPIISNIANDTCTRLSFDFFAIKAVYFND